MSEQKFESNSFKEFIGAIRDVKPFQFQEPMICYNCKQEISKEEKFQVGMHARKGGGWCIWYANDSMYWHKKCPRIIDSSKEVSLIEEKK